MKILLTLLLMSHSHLLTAMQSQNEFESCSAKLRGEQKIRVSPGVIQGLVLKQSVPASAAKSVKNADAKIKILIDDAGSVLCATGVEGDPAFYDRSTDAAKLWKFKPYVLNGRPISVESAIYFRFNKGKVKAKFCSHC